jgi:hypothetical protein
MTAAGRLFEIFPEIFFTRIFTGFLSVFPARARPTSSFPQVCFLYWQQFNGL